MSLIDFVLGFSGMKKLSEQDRKSAAEWGFLLSTVFIVPLFFLTHASELVKIALQLLWGACVSRAAFMANDSWKKNRKR
ncbi:hypothetical protein [Erwinia mallotivora]|uniref:hypothetical protein n=1 Tax=Erwinia mallotivora TaxID=69222 RepID=UPI0021C0EB87|nr:hypothetical protein [Erwinia mallotivora]